MTRRMSFYLIDYLINVIIMAYTGKVTYSDDLKV